MLYIFWECLGERRSKKMASIEGERNEEVVGQLTLEQKARLDEVMKQAELSLQSDELLNKAAAGKLLGNNYIAVSGVLSNYSKGPLTLVAQHQYSGSVIMDYTNPIDAADSNNNPGRGYFIMEGDGSVEAAAVYNGKNNKGDQDCGWLFGFNINKRIQPEVRAKKSLPRYIYFSINTTHFIRP